MNTRAKGQRTFGKALRFAHALYPNAYVLPIYQVSRWAHPQPFDMMILEFDHRPICVEVRTNQWGVSKPQTKVLAHLPGCVFKEIWMFQRGQAYPAIRRWDGTAWESSGGGESSFNQGRGETGIVSPAASASCGRTHG